MIVELAHFPETGWEDQRSPNFWPYFKALGFFQKAFFCNNCNKLNNTILKDEIWALLIWSVSLSWVIVDMVENPIFISFNFINAFFLSRSNFNRSPKFLQFIYRSGFTTVCNVCWNSENLPLNKKGTIA